MASPNVRRIDPPRRVEVLHDGRWWPGFQDAWVWWNDGWRASVEFVAQHDWGQGKYVKSVRTEEVRLPE